MQHTADDGETYLAIHEFYTMHDKKEGWTSKPVPIAADNVSEMRQALLAILTDIERHGVRDANTGKPLPKNTPGGEAEGECPPRADGSNEDG